MRFAAKVAYAEGSEYFYNRVMNNGCRCLRQSKLWRDVNEKSFFVELQRKLCFYQSVTGKSLRQRELVARFSGKNEPLLLAPICSK